LDLFQKEGIMAATILNSIGNVGRTEPLAVFGDQGHGGTYVLRVRADTRLRLAFGRFKGGKIITVEPGDYIYVGSALAERGPACLARRLVRHATRTGKRPPHAVRHAMMDEFARLGLGDADLRPANGKNLRWNVDHLLDQSSASLVAVYAIRSPLRLEADLGKLVEMDQDTVVFEKGLGANDIPGNTHLLRVDGGESWWQSLSERLHKFCCERASIEGLAPELRVG